MLTKKDLNAIKKLEEELETRLTEKNIKAIEKIETRLAGKNLEAIKLLIGVEFDEQLDKKLKRYFDKDKMYQKLDYIIGKLDAGGDEQVLVINTQEDHEDRLAKLEKIHPKNKHAFAIAP